MSDKSDKNPPVAVQVHGVPTTMVHGGPMTVVQGGSTLVQAVPAAAKKFNARGHPTALEVQELQEVEWNDPFFQSERNVVAVFDHKTEEMIEFWKAQTRWRLYIQLVVITLGGIFVIVLGFDIAIVIWLFAYLYMAMWTRGCYLAIESMMRARHVAILDEAVYFALEKRLAFRPIMVCILSFCDKGVFEDDFHQKVPFDQIVKFNVTTASDYFKNGGFFKSCCGDGGFCIPFCGDSVFRLCCGSSYPFSTVFLQTSAGDAGEFGEILDGLDNSKLFVDTLLAMKGYTRDAVGKAHMRETIQNRVELIGNQNQNQDRSDRKADETMAMFKQSMDAQLAAQKEFSKQMLEKK